jgi:TfoX/Sxy family transcriptional regulator of competence genes
MALDARLVDRVRERVDATDGVTELRMFGGWGVTIHGNMAVGVMGDDLIVRVGPDAFDGVLKRPGTRPFDFTGRPMSGWVFVDGTTVKNGRTLDRWVNIGVSFAESLPRKTRPARPRTTTSQASLSTRCRWLRRGQPFV